MTVSKSRGLLFFFQGLRFVSPSISKTPRERRMAGEGFGLASNLAGMSKNQLYDIMSQMKNLIEQNQKQAKQVLVDNPALTKALFQAQIMLGMVQSSQVMPSVQQASSQPPQQSVQPGQQPGVQACSLPVQVGVQEQASASQIQFPARKQQIDPPLPPMPSASVSPVTIQAQTLQSHSLQSFPHPKGHLNMQGTSMSLSPSSQMHNIPPPPIHSAPQPTSLLHSQVSSVSSQSQQSLHSSGTQHLPLQPPFPPQPRPPMLQPFQHQLHSHMGPHLGFQSSGPAHPLLSQPQFNSGAKHLGSMGSSYPQGQPPLPNQPPPPSLYQAGGSHLGPDFNNQPGSSMQVDRASLWMSGLSENSMGRAHLPLPPPLPNHMGPGNQPPRPQQMTTEMEKAILQQVMSLTPEQINLLPQEQRHQVLQLQQMLRSQS